MINYAKYVVIAIVIMLYIVAVLKFKIQENKLYHGIFVFGAVTSANILPYIIVKIFNK